MQRGPIGRPERAVASAEEASMTQKITPCLWFDDNAEEAMKFYV